MHSFQVKVKTKYASCVIFLVFCLSTASAYNSYWLHDKFTLVDPEIVTIDHGRVKRDTAPAPAPVPLSPASLPEGDNATVHLTDDSNRTTNLSTTAAPTTVSVTQIPLLGQNGSGILHVNLTDKLPKVSEPIAPDDNITEFFKSPESIQAEKNLTKLEYDNHNFYNSTFIGNQTYFDEYWANMTKNGPTVHEILSNSHRRATTVKLSFDFPFYGHPIQNITVATGGFIYTGEHVHNWLAATQYIAPLMANFDTHLTNDSYVKTDDDGQKFVALWENVTLQEDTSKQFTFAVVLMKNGDIDFVYKHIPLNISDINDSEHPVKVGISDAYLTDRIMFFVRRKTIYEYHRVSYKNHQISNGTILHMKALPTCLQYDTCDSCVNHDTGFNCSWCDAIQKCSSGTDRNKQDWLLRNCEQNQINTNGSCPAAVGAKPANEAERSTAYVTEEETKVRTNVVTAGEQPAPETAPVRSVSQPAPAPRSAIGGVVAAFVAVALVCAVAAWALYAFKNPHTRSGQLLIKYRPSQWSWRRGEARYTAATIHM